VKISKVASPIGEIDKTPPRCSDEFNRGYFVAVSHRPGNSRPNLRVSMNKNKVLISPPSHEIKLT